MKLQPLRRFVLRSALVAVFASSLPISFAAATFAQDDTKTPIELSAETSHELDTFLTKLGEKRKFSGTVLIAQEGRILFEKSIGTARGDQQEPFNRSSSFRLASVSKQFTAMAIMLLKEQGKLNFDDPVTRFIGDFPYPKVTIRHLLHHTSGLPDYMALCIAHFQPDVKLDEREAVTNQVIVDLLVEHQPKLEFEPGKRFAYSNTGYALLAYIAERASGQPFAEFMEERVFEPLKMDDSAVFQLGDKFQVKHRVYGFAFAWKADRPNRPNDWHFLNGVYGDGGIYASARDLVKWDQALYTEKLVSRQTMQLAFSPAVLNDGKKSNYGFGWMLKKDKSGVLHSGGWVGFRTFIFRDFDRKIVMVALSNNSAVALQKVIEKLGEVRESLPK